jgi:hypothetical protein
VNNNAAKDAKKTKRKGEKRTQKRRVAFIKKKDFEQEKHTVLDKE